MLGSSLASLHLTEFRTSLVLTSFLRTVISIRRRLLFGAFSTGVLWFCSLVRYSVSPGMDFAGVLGDHVTVVNYLLARCLALMRLIAKHNGLNFIASHNDPTVTLDQFGCGGGFFDARVGFCIE